MRNVAGIICLGSVMLTGIAIAAPAPTGGEAASTVLVQPMLDWAHESFAGGPRPERLPHIPLAVKRQDFSVLNFGRSSMETPIAIGARPFEHGLGTHANSEIEVRIPEGAVKFKALVGVDNNVDTQGRLGSVIFSVAASERGLFRSPVLRGGQEPVAIDLDLPPRTDTLLLKVDSTSDGPSNDQADWADAQFVLGDGSIRYLDTNQSPLLFLKDTPPFSFTYNGIPSAELLPNWDYKVEEHSDDAAERHTASWTDPVSGLTALIEVTGYKNFPAVDWLLAFENRGGADTPILEDIQSLDTTLRTGVEKKPAILHTLDGDGCNATSFLAKDIEIAAGKSLRLMPTLGRPASVSAFPFFDFEYNDTGLIAGIGWTGQWCSQFDRAATGPTRVRIGLERTRLLLHAGERIRGPRLLLMAWSGDRLAAHNQFRQLMFANYTPQENGKPVPMPTVLQTFDRYNGRKGWATEAEQRHAVQVGKTLGCDTYWLDAAWFPGNFPNGVGNWFTKPDAFPHGLKPVGDAAHQNGMKFVLWFEPERVGADTKIAKEHPDWVFGGSKGGLFKLNDPKARVYLTDALSKCISDYGVDVFRNDFNIDPLEAWRNNDTPDRQGMTEIRYVEGLYALWDALVARHPGLRIDNCASGGRRIDLETSKRATPFWRSDTSCSPGHPHWNQVQSMGLSQYIPLHTATVWALSRYEARSAATSGLIVNFDYLDAKFPLETAKALIAEARENMKFWYGDFYPLTAINLNQDQFTAWQYHRPDLNAGIVLAFRRPDCPIHGLLVGPHGIQPDHTYRVTFIDEAGESKEQTMSGADLQRELPLNIPEANSSLLVRYEYK
jgi:alpha-galactosidase